MTIQFTLNPFWVVGGLYFIEGTALVLGIFSSLWPNHSISLYTWIMASLNWRVSPIDEGLEVRNTRFLGIILILFSLMGLGVLIGGRI